MIRRTTPWSILIFFSVVFLAYGGGKKFWEEKAYSEWDEKETKKILNKSPWSKTITLSFGGGGMGGRGGMGGGGGGMGGRGGGMGGAPKMTLSWYSRPLREAMARNLVLANPEVGQEALDKYLKYKDDEYIYILMSGGMTGMMSGGGRGAREGMGGDPEQMAARREQFMAELREKTYLEKKNKEKIPLANAVPPQGRGNPFIFQFLREIDGKPTVTLADKEVRFKTQIANQKINSKFKLKDMVIDGKLEI